MNELLCKYATGIPKCELHVHIEGTLEPELMMKLSQRNQISLPFDSAEEIKLAMNYQNLQEFLNLYSLGTNVLIKEEDFYDLTTEYLIKAYNNNVKHAEIMFDPQLHTNRGIKFETVLNGIIKAQEYIKNEYELSSKLICCFHRNIPLEQHWDTFENIKQNIKVIDGIGLDNSEKGFPCSLFQSLYERAKELGLKCVAHAGEEGPASNIWEAIDLLKVDRVDHGVNATEDIKLIETLIERKTHITACPISNFKLKVINAVENHPLLKVSESEEPTEGSYKIENEFPKGSSKAPQILDLINKGLKVSIHSDDPSYFGGYINDNFCECILTGKLNWTFSTIRKLVENAIDGSFMDNSRKREIFDQIESYHQIFFTQHSASCK